MFLRFSTAVIILPALIFTIIPRPVHAQSLSTRYQQNRANLQASFNTIQQNLREKTAQLYDITQQKNTLQAEITRRRNEIKLLDEQITQIRLLEAEKQSQIEENEKKRDKLLLQMQEIVPLLQKQSRKSPIQIIGESMMSDNTNIGEVGRLVFGLSSLQVQLDKLDRDLKDINEQLIQDKEQLSEMRRTQENSRYILLSQEDGLRILLEETQGEEAKYQELVKTMKDQLVQQEAQIKQLDAQEAERRRIEAEQARIAANNQQNTGTPSNSNSTGSGTNAGNNNTNITRPPIGRCRFEDGRNLPVRLSAPTTGGISDVFGCPTPATKRNHDGYDIANREGTPIVAAYAGVVERKGFHPKGFGHFIMLRHDVSGVTFFTLYAHLSEQSPLPIGASVAQGARIGSMGSTGYVVRGLGPGTHLHFMIISDTYLGNRDAGCDWGSSLCFDPGKFTNF